jgi:hypothetical protein
MQWYNWLALFGPSLPAARWYYGFLRERSHRSYSLHGGLMPTPDRLLAAIAISVSIIWPLVVLIFLVMSNPRPTSLEIQQQREAMQRYNEELEAENARLLDEAGAHPAVESTGTKIVRSGNADAFKPNGTYEEQLADIQDRYARDLSELQRWHRREERKP